MERKKLWQAGIGLSVGIVLAATVTALVQGQNEPSRGEERPPAVRQRSARSPHKLQLRQQLRALGEINRDSATAVTPDQAKQLLAVLKPWTTKDKMTEEDTKTIIRSVQRLMTERQLNAMAQVRPQRGRGFGGPGGGEGRRERFRGPRGPEGADRRGREGGPARFDRSRMNAMRDANILSTQVDPEMPWASRRAEANQRLIAMLEARAQGGTTSGTS